MTSWNYDLLPKHMRGAMQRWIEHGILPGDFLTAILENDFIGACARADSTNQKRLFDYALFLYNEAPRGSFGSKKAVETWRAHQGLEGMKLRT